MGSVEEKGEMEGAAAELKQRSRYLSDLIQQQRRSTNVHSKAAEERPKGGSEEAAKAPTKQVVQGRKEAAMARVVVVPEPPRGLGHGGGGGAVLRERPRLVRVRAADMAPELQKRAFWCAGGVLAGMGRLDSKRLALAMKKEFDSSYGPAWHCIVGTNFGSYVTHSVGGFLYFSIDKAYILLFRTAVQPLTQ